MDVLVVLIVAMATIVNIEGNYFDPERQILNNSSHLLPQPNQQRYKEIILYLTPTQIKALQEGRGLINPPLISHAESDKHTQPIALTNPQLLAHNQNGHIHTHLNGHLHAQPVKAPTSQESQLNPSVPIVPPPNYRQLDSVAYNTVQSQNQKRILKPVPFFPDPNQEAPNNEPKALRAGLPQETFQEKDQDNQLTRQQLKEQWLRLLEQNIAHFKALEALYQNQREKSNESKINFHYLSQNYQRYNDHKYASDVYNLVRSNNEHELEKQVPLKAESTVSPQSILVHKEINIKHTPAPLIAHISVPTPVFIPVPESFNFKSPQAYEVPLEILSTVPLPILKTQIKKLDSPGPIESEKHIPLPVAKKVYVDRPFFVDHVVPVENPALHRGRLPVHNHEWHH